MRKAVIAVALFALLAGGCKNVMPSEVQKLVSWKASTTYSRGGFTNEEGVVYESLADANLNHEPVVSPTWWEVSQ